MAEEKTDNMIWVKIGANYAGPEGFFIKDEIRNLKESLVSKIKKQIKPKVIPAPWNAQKDDLAANLNKADSDLGDAQARLTRLRTARDKLIEARDIAAEELTKLDKLTTADLQADPRKVSLRKQNAAAVNYHDAQIEIVEADIEAAEAEVVSLNDKAGDLRGKLEKRRAREARKKKAK